MNLKISLATVRCLALALTFLPMGAHAQNLFGVETDMVNAITGGEPDTQATYAGEAMVLAPAPRVLTPYELAWADGKLDAKEARNMTFTKEELNFVLSKYRKNIRYSLDTMPATYTDDISPSLPEATQRKLRIRALHKANTDQARKVLFFFTSSGKELALMPIKMVMSANVGAKASEFTYNAATGKDLYTGKPVTARQIVTREVVNYGKGKALGRATRGVKGNPIIQKSADAAVVSPALKRGAELFGQPAKSTRPQKKQHRSTSSTRYRPTRYRPARS